VASAIRFSVPVVIVFATLPLWHFRPFGHISVMECGLIVGLLLVIGRGRAFRANFLDILVLVFAFTNLLSVLLSEDQLYEGARYYRVHVLVPVLVYAFVRLSGMELRQVPRVIPWMALVVGGLSLQLVSYFITAGSRPLTDATDTGFMNLVSFGYWCAFIIAAGIFSLAEYSKLKRYSIIAPVLLLVLAALVISANRASTLSLLIVFPFLMSPLGTRHGGRVLQVASIGFLVFVLLLVATGPMLAEIFDLGNVDRLEARQIDRILNIDLWISDGIGRALFWRDIVVESLSSPILGQGSAAYTIGRQSLLGVSFASAHNVLVSQFVVGGIIGLGLFLSLLIVSVSYLARCRMRELPSDTRAGVKCVWFALFTMVLVVCTNDVTAGRGTVLFALIALTANLEKSRRAGVILNEEPFAGRDAPAGMAVGRETGNPGFLPNPAQYQSWH